MGDLKRLGEYEIVRFLGRGGMGAVFEARQSSLDRSVALKMLPEWFAGDPDALDRFRREAAVAAQLDHPHIVPIFAIGHEDGQHFYTMKLIRGLSLAELIRSGPDETATAPLKGRTDQAGSEADPTAVDGDKPIVISHGTAFSGESDTIFDDYRDDRPAFAARIRRQSARALAFAHQRGQIHRDIKPSNIMVDAHGQAYVIDFGLVRAIEQTQSASFCGTLKYMSPEQIEHSDLDERTDLYSLGCTLYELVAQVPPFRGRDERDLIGKIREGNPAPLAEHAPDVPPALADCIQRAMAKNRDERYASAAEFETALNAAATELARTPRAAVVPAPRPALATGPMWVIVVVAVLIAVGAGVAFQQWISAGDGGGKDTDDSNGNDPPIPVTLLARRPEVLVNEAGVPPEFSEFRRQVVVDAKSGTTLLTLGTTDREDYKLEVLIVPTSTAPPRGPPQLYAGLFFGGQKATLREGVESLRCGAILIDATSDNDVSVRRRVLTVVLDKNRVDKNRVAGRSNVASQSLGARPGHSYKLEVTISPHGIKSLRCNGKTIEQLVLPHITDRIDERPMNGRFGIVLSTGSATFRMARLTTPKK